MGKPGVKSGRNKYRQFAKETKQSSKKQFCERVSQVAIRKSSDQYAVTRVAGQRQCDPGMHGYMLYCSSHKLR